MTAIWRVAAANEGATAVVIVDARTDPRIVIGDRDTVGINTEDAAARTLRRTGRTTVRVTPIRHIRSRTGEADTRPTRIPTPRSSPTARMAVIVGVEVEVEVGDTTRTIAEGEAEEVTITLMAALMAETRTANHMAMADTTAAPTVAMVATVETAVVEAMVAGVVAVAIKEEAAAAVDHMAAAAMADSSKTADAAASTKARTETPTTTIRVGVTTDRVAVEEDVGDYLAAPFFFVEYFFM